MHSNDAKAIAAKNVIDGATVDELREAVNDLRALSPESAWRTWWRPRSNIC